MNKSQQLFYYVFILLLVFVLVTSCSKPPKLEQQIQEQLESEQYELVPINVYKVRGESLTELEKEYTDRYVAKDFDACILIASKMANYANSNVVHELMYYDALLHWFNVNKDNTNPTLYYNNIDITLRNIYSVCETDLDSVVTNDYVKNMFYLAKDYLDQVDIYN